MQEQLEADRIRNAREKKVLCLNFVPGLEGKSNRQKFIIKVYSLLTIELLFTFGFILTTFLVPSKQDSLITS